MMENLFKKCLLRGLLASLFFLHYTSASAQYDVKENNFWAFGYKTGLDFNSGNPVVTPPLGLPSNNTGTAAVSDPAGELLFYTNGHAVWNKNDQMMPNGDVIFPVVGRLSPYSSSQGALIVPVLNNPDQYYIFSQEATSDADNDTAVCRLWYSVVDMTLENGLGDVVTGQKSIPVDSGLTGSMIAIQGDDCNIWVLTHQMNSTVFKAYNINATGVNREPVISDIGTLQPGAYRWGRMRVSPDRKKLGLISTGNGGGITGAGVEMYDFDPATGTLSNAMFIDQIGGNGIAFSPDNSKMYVTGVVPVTYTYSMFQFDATQTTAADIKNSRQTIENTQWTDLRLAPNGKIYYIKSDHAIGVINNPNLSGAACNYVPDVLVSPGPPWAYSFGMYFPAEYIKGTPADTILSTALDTLVCPNFGTLTLHAEAGASSNLWDDGSTGDVRQISEPGVYYVESAVGFCTNRIDTFVVGVYDVIKPVISVNGFELGTSGSYSAYQWFLNGMAIEGANNSTYTVVENGDYTVVVETENGCIDTSDIYKVENVTSLNNLNDVAAKIITYPNPAKDLIHVQSPVDLNIELVDIDGRVLKIVESASQIGIQDLANGIYFLRVNDKEGNLIKVEKVVKGEL